MLTPQAPSKQPSVAAHTGPIVRDDIRTKVLIALRWTTLSKFSGQLVSWAVTVYVIRILSPDDYGLMAMASVPIIFFYLLNTVGLDAVLVQKRDLSERLRAQVFGIVILVNLVLFLGFLGGAPWIAAFYHEPRLPPWFGSWASSSSCLPSRRFPSLSWNETSTSAADRSWSW